MFAAVCFDLDETLLLDEPVSRQAFWVTALECTREDESARTLARAAEEEAKALWSELPREAAEYAMRIGHSALEGLWATYDPRIPAEVSLEQATARFRPEAWRRALEKTGLRGDPRSLAARWQQLRARFPLFDDTDAVLARLRPITKLALITNGVAGLQRRKIDGSGLAPWFDIIAVSGEVGIGKPERGIFEWTAQRLGVPLEQCAMVGDNSERDVAGGLAAGMFTAWIDRKWKPRGVAAHTEAPSLHELWPWLAGGGK